MLVWSRVLYGLVSVNASGSVDIRLTSCSIHSSSSSMRSRSAAVTRKWWAHFGQTLRLVARSLLQMICEHSGHFTQRPSGTRLAFSLASLIGLRAFLNQAIADQLSKLLTGGGDWRACS